MSSTAFVLVWVSLLGADPETGKNPMLAQGAKLEKLWSEGTFTEGGALSGDGAILFSDIGNRLMRFDPKEGKTHIFRDPSARANGVVFDPKGRLIVAEGANTGGGRRVSITELDGTIRTLADRYEGKRFNSPNDVAVDAQGRVYVSDPRYVGDEPRELDDEAVYRIDPDGTVTKLNTTATKPNGLAISPDGKTFYVSDNGPKRRALIALNLDAAGNVSKPKVLKSFGEGRGIDGLTVTIDGKIVATAGAGPLAGIYIYEPDGSSIGFIGVPETPANVEFGGPERKTLYIMAGVSLYRVETTLTGFHVWPPKAH